MAKKNERITAVHLMAVLTENKGIGMRYTDVYKAMRARGWKHNYTSTIDNLRFLVSQGNIVKTDWHLNPRYGVPVVREDGTKYIVLKNQGFEDETVELGK